MTDRSTAAVSARQIRLAVATLPFVAGAWAVMFAWVPLNFWVMMTTAQVAMISAALAIRPDLLGELRPRPIEILVGLASAAVLYGVFVVGNGVAAALFGFAPSQVDGIYAVRGETPYWVIGLLLLFVIGPGEEIFWRGLIQQTLARRLGGWRALLVTTALYAGVHIVAWNFMLIGAAAVCGLFWGLLYLWRRSLFTVVLCHAVWDVVVLVIWPIV